MKRDDTDKKRLEKAIDDLIERIRRLEEELARERFENQTLRTTIEDLKRQLREKQQQLEAMK